MEPQSALSLSLGLLAAAASAIYLWIVRPRWTTDYGQIVFVAFLAWAVVTTAVFCIFFRPVGETIAMFLIGAASVTLLVGLSLFEHWLNRKRIPWRGYFWTIVTGGFVTVAVSLTFSASG